MITASHCLQLDHQDPISELRQQFALPPDTIYFNGNSLGAQPKSAVARAQQVLQQEWGHDLVRSWNTAGWFELPSRLGDLLAPLIGAQPNEVVITDSTSINLFKALTAALRIQQKRHPDKKMIVSERGNFPTDLYIAQGVTHWLNQGYRLKLVDSVEQLSDAIDRDTAVVLLTHVNYRNGEMLDMQHITHHTQAHNALIIWDLSHSAGAVPVDLNRCQADFAVGCTYKYLNGGPGAPAYIWVSKRHLPDFQHPLSGWWGHANPFAMQPEFVPSASIQRALCGAQPIISLSLVECGLQTFQQTSMSTLREKSLALSDLFIQLVEQRCASHSLELVTPRQHHQRASQVSFMHPHAYPIMQALIARRIIGDYREPSVMRFGFAPLYTRYIDVWNAVETLCDILDNHLYDVNVSYNLVT